MIFPLLHPLALHTHFSPWEGYPFLSDSGTFLLLAGLFPFAQFFGAPFIGSFSDQKGRKKAFLFSISGTTIGYICLALGFSFFYLPITLCGRFITGFFAGNLTLCLATLADSSPSDLERRKNFSLIAAVGGLSFIFAILVMQSLGRFNPAAPFWLMTLLSCLNFTLIKTAFVDTYTLTPSPRPHFFNRWKPFIEILRCKDFLFLYLIYFFIILSLVSTVQILPAILINYFQISSNFILLLYLILGLLWTFSNIILVRSVFSKRSTYQSLEITLATLTCLCIIGGFAQSFTVFLVFITLAIMTFSLSWINNLVLLSMRAKNTMQGKVLGMTQACGALAAALGPLVALMLYKASPTYSLFFSGLSCLLAFICLTKISPKASHF